MSKRWNVKDFNKQCIKALVQLDESLPKNPDERRKFWANYGFWNKTFLENGLNIWDFKEQLSKNCSDLVFDDFVNNRVIETILNSAAIAATYYDKSLYYNYVLGRNPLSKRRYSDKVYDELFMRFEKINEELSTIDKPQGYGDLSFMYLYNLVMFNKKEDALGLINNEISFYDKVPEARKNIFQMLYSGLRLAMIPKEYMNCEGKNLFESLCTSIHSINDDNSLCLSNFLDDSGEYDFSIESSCAEFYINLFNCFLKTKKEVFDDGMVRRLLCEFSKFYSLQLCKNSDFAILDFEDISKNLNSKFTSELKGIVTENIPGAKSNPEYYTSLVTEFLSYVNSDYLYMTSEEILDTFKKYDIEKQIRIMKARKGNDIFVSGIGLSKGKKILPSSSKVQTEAAIRSSILVHDNANIIGCTNVCSNYDSLYTGYRAYEFARSDMYPISFTINISDYPSLKDNPDLKGFDSFSFPKDLTVFINSNNIDVMVWLENIYSKSQDGMAIYREKGEATYIMPKYLYEFFETYPVSKNDMRRIMTNYTKRFNEIYPCITDTDSRHPSNYFTFVEHRKVRSGNYVENEKIPKPYDSSLYKFDKDLWAQKMYDVLTYTDKYKNMDKSPLFDLFVESGKKASKIVSDSRALVLKKNE